MYKTDIKSFDFDRFFSKYSLVYSDSKVAELIDALQNPEKAVLFGFNNRSYENKVRRFKEIEQVILTDPQWSVWYAVNILQERWPEAEGLIMQFPQLWEDYSSKINSIRYHKEIRENPPSFDCPR